MVSCVTAVVDISTCTNWHLWLRFRSSVSHLHACTLFSYTAKLPPEQFRRENLAKFCHKLTGIVHSEHISHGWHGSRSPGVLSYLGHLLYLGRCAWWNIYTSLRQYMLAYPYSLKNTCIMILVHLATFFYGTWYLYISNWIVHQSKNLQQTWPNKYYHPVNYFPLSAAQEVSE